VVALRVLRVLREQLLELFGRELGVVLQRIRREMEYLVVELIM
jgi:hypothetical protein